MRVYILIVVQNLYSSNNVQSQFNYVFCYRVSQSRYMPPPDPAGQDEQGRDQQSVHDEAEQEEEQAEDPSWDGLDDVEQP